MSEETFGRTGAAAFIVDGLTLHTLLSLPMKGNFEDLEGKRLQTIQQSMQGVQHIIIDEMSMVGRKMFGKIDRRLRQVLPHRSAVQKIIMNMCYNYTELKNCLVGAL